MPSTAEATQLHPARQEVFAAPRPNFRLIRHPKSRFPRRLTMQRLRLLAAAVEHPDQSTAELSAAADLTRSRAHVALSALARQSWVTSVQRGKSHARAWRATAAGVAALHGLATRRCNVKDMGVTVLTYRYPHDTNGTAKVPPAGLVSTAIEAVDGLRRKLRAWGVAPSLLRLDRAGQRGRRRIFLDHSLSYVMSVVLDLEAAVAAGKIRNPGAVLYYRLYRDRDENRRRSGCAIMLLEEARLSRDVADAYDQEARDLPPRLYVRLAYWLRACVRRGRRVGVGDVRGVAGMMRKRERRLNP